MKGRRGRVVGAAAALAAFAACGRDVSFDRAASRERAGAYAQAAQRFERFAGRYPSDPRAAEALVRAGRVYVYVFQRCPEALPLLERAARAYPDSPWAEQARATLLDCPEYFPVRQGARWTYVDSQTRGRNMRLELASAALSPTEIEIRGSYYAGTRRFQDFRWRYAKRDWAVWEIAGRDRVPILRYPYRRGNRWSGRRGGRPVDFRIESSEEVVAVSAGTFHHCLKVRESQRGLPAWKYDYYAPGVGRIKTTVAGPGFENPNTELRSAQVPLPPSPPAATGASL